MKNRVERDILSMVLEDCGTGTEGGDMRSDMGLGQMKNHKGFIVMVSE